MEEQQNISEPHVQVFGQEVNEYKKDEKKKKYCQCDDKHWRHHHHHDGGSVIWGLIVLLGGVILLLNYMGAVSWGFWNVIWPLWPVLLILFGVRIIFGHNWVSSIITFLIGLAVLGFVAAYGLVQIHSPIANYFPAGLIDTINTFNQPKQ